MHRKDCKYSELTRGGKEAKPDMNSQFIQGIQFEWNNLDEHSYVREIQAFQGLEPLEFSKSVTFFVGENGSGKSTLLEAIAVAHGFNPEGGTKNYVFSTYDEYPELCDAIRLSKGYRKEKWGYFLRAESFYFYNVATREEQYADIAHPSAEYHKQSHGESFLALVHDNFGANGLYLLDEPEAEICCFDKGPVHRCSYEETASYQITELFINHREEVLKNLLANQN